MCIGFEKLEDMDPHLIHPVFSWFTSTSHSYDEVAMQDSRNNEKPMNCWQVIYTIVKFI